MVPLFIAISGYFLAAKNVENFNGYLSFLKKQIPRVYMPYFLWSVFWFGLFIVISDKAICQGIVKMLTFQAWPQYYFISLIIQFYLLLPILKRLASPKGVVISSIISIIATYIIAYFQYNTDLSAPLIVYDGNFLTYLMFFVLGLYLGKVKIKANNKMLIIFTLIFYVLSCVESYVLIAMYGKVGDAVTAVKAFSFIYSFTLILFLFNNINLVRSNFINNIGKMSFAIFLIHGFALVGVAMLLEQVYPSLQIFSPAYQLVLLGMTMLLCMICICIFNHLFTNKLSRLIGFK